MVPTAPDLETPLGFEPRHFEPVRMGWISSSPEDKRARVDRSSRLRWRLESERAPLIRPGHRQVDETLETKAARQASFDCCLCRAILCRRKSRRFARTTWWSGGDSNL
jgi:hypothetical protein